MARDGFEAISAFQSQDFDLILMDVHMPQKDGYETTQVIRKLHKYKDLPIIAMTANALSSDIDKALEVGMSDHIAKPINEAEMLEKITRLLPKLDVR